ncbi:chemotaxis protein CheB [Nonomuraea rhizosphaerae]|uniref:chemotaxis protein CheB n=1 Tax=Nonomuraea rhizosphaerae TaxID=2665663 RepID=UPI001C5D39D6|nr:chemotaxis protein CheB [Nonomuraea rhizosphaerae]
MRTAGRDVVVIAASAGGVEPLRTMLSELPGDLPASVMVVLHVSPRGTSVLANILDRAGPLKAAPAEDQEQTQYGRVYVAQPDHHLLLHEGRTRLSRGPQHNGHRPAADPLFMSAALDAGPRVSAVVLSGTLDDGAKGCEAVRRQGGAIAVQDVAECAFPGMPAAALAAVPNAVSLPARGLAHWITAQTRTPVTAEERVDDDGTEWEVAQVLRHAPIMDDPNGQLLGLTCPQCNGPLFEQHSDRISRYVCRVGHAWSHDSMIEAQSDAVEQALWVAIQRLEERVRMLERMLEQAGERGQRNTWARYHEEANRTREALRTIRGLQSRIGNDGDNLLSS